MRRGLKVFLKHPPSDNLINMSLYRSSDKFDYPFTFVVPRHGAIPDDVYTTPPLVLFLIRGGYEIDGDRPRAKPPVQGGPTSKNFQVWKSLNSSRMSSRPSYLLDTSKAFGMSLYISKKCEVYPSFIYFCVVEWISKYFDFFRGFFILMIKKN